jgi:hypothetical protein
MHRGSRKLSITAAVAIAVLTLSTVALGATAVAKTSHAHYWFNTPASVICGYRNNHKPATQLACRGTNIPGGGVKKCAKPGTFAPAYAVLAAHGKTQVVVTCKHEWSKAGHFVTLPGGTTWSGIGITCKLTGTDGKTVTCTNKSHHGFKTGNGKYRSF